MKKRRRLKKKIRNRLILAFGLLIALFIEYIKLDRDKSTFKSHRDFSSEIEITFKHF